MALEHEQKAALIQRFAPVLFLHTQESEFPVRPEAFLERSALWSAVPPYDNKMLWGQGDNITRHPLIPRGGISISPLDPLLHHPHQEGELWLDTSGWARDEAVEAATDNRACSPATHLSPYQPNSDGPWFYAEVCDFDTILNWFEFQTARRELGLEWGELEEVTGRIIIICYYFLFPRHLESSKMARADGSLEPSANYEGDWTCFAVVARQADEPALIDQPLFAGFSRRRRGASGDFGVETTQEYMELLPWDQVPAASEHAGVMAALGTHNLYPLGTAEGQPGGISPQFWDMGESASEPANKFVQGAVESPAGKASSAVTLAKILAGLAIGGPIGAIIGGIAGGAEAVEIHEGLDEEPELEPGDGSPPEWPDDLEDPRDQLLDPENAQAIVPQGQEGLVPILTGNEAGAAAVSFWLDDRDATVVDRFQQLFWADGIGQHMGYNGRWGVRCSDDPFNRRAGAKFPEFRLQVLKRLVVEI